MSPTKIPTRSKAAIAKEEKVRMSAYFHWLEQGCPEGTEASDWLWAEEANKAKPRKRAVKATLTTATSGRKTAAKLDQAAAA